MIYNPWKVQQVIDDIWYMIHKDKPDTLIKDIDDPWLISDTHFNHKKIGEYCDRPEGWQKLIIHNWNSVVKDGDTVIHFGDIAFANKEQMYNITRQLNGNIFLIKGNHDRHSKKWYEDVGIIVIPKFMINLENSDDVIYFTHRIIKDKKFNGVNIHGHSHNTRPFITIDKQGVYVNISVENINYTPQKLSEILDSITEHTKELYDTSSIPLSAKILTKEEMEEMANKVTAKDVLRQVPIYHIGNVSLVDTRKILDEYLVEFIKWMEDMTTPFFDNYVYSWEWERWCKMRFDKVPTYWKE
jgi:calcineurin-like phosphoesterase family protein